ncbi:MAG: hypothetical protein LBK44_00200 [Spirochaetales bacterium]|nr:hypothetical protein [Spirochaetales bacterium]
MTSGRTHQNFHLLGAFLALRAKNRAFRSKSSEAPMRFLRAFHSNPIAQR